MTYQYRAVWRPEGKPEFSQMTDHVNAARSLATILLWGITGTVERRQIGEWESEADINARAQFLAALDDEDD